MRTFLFILSTAALVVPLSAQNACPCVPLTHLWIVKTCPDWNCVNTELLLANGDPQVIAIPVGIGDHRWLLVRRFAAGGAIQDPNDSFRIQQFDGMDGAVGCYRGLGTDMRPLLMTAPDGQVLVIALRQSEPAPPKRHAVNP